MSVFTRIRGQFAKTPIGKGTGISLLVPFRSDHGRRQETWNWLEKYWQSELPGAEIILGNNNSTPFCKTAAVNVAARKAHGDVFVILDADCYIPGDVVFECAMKIRNARRDGHSLWFMPYRHFYRLTDSASKVVLKSDPRFPPRFYAAAPEKNQVENSFGSAQGHWFGALIQIMPKEAFFAVGGMDERFAGWGGEDVSFMKAVDTLYGKHKSTPNGVIHLWHPSNGNNAKDRMWDGQEKVNPNGDLAWRYSQASGDHSKMLALVNEHGDKSE